MRVIIFVFVLIGFFSCKNEKPNDVPELKKSPDSEEVSLKKIWETGSSLITSESVVFDSKMGGYYVSCIGNIPPNKEDGDGYIAIIDQRGNILNPKWIEELDAPKGMGIFGDKLFVTDINEFVVIDKKAAKIIQRIPIEGATFLNDVAIGLNGKVYFTDSDQNTIHVYENGTVSLFKQDKSLGGTNGIFIDGNQMHLAGYGNGDINSIDLNTGVITNRGKGVVPGGDGIAPWKNSFFFSNWNGEIYLVDNKWNANKLLDTKNDKINAADIAVNPKSKELLVPTFFGNSVVAYQIEN